MFIWPDGRPGAVQRAGRERPLPSTQPSRACCGFTNRLRTSPATVSEAAEVRRFVPIVSSSLPPADCLPGGGSRTAHRLRCVVGRWTCRAVRSKISSIRFDRAIERPRSTLSCIGTASVCKDLAAPDRGVFQAGSDEACRKRELLPDHGNGRVPSARMYPGPVEALSRGIGCDFTSGATSAIRFL